MGTRGKVGPVVTENLILSDRGWLFFPTIENPDGDADPGGRMMFGRSWTSIATGKGNTVGNVGWKLWKLQGRTERFGSNPQSFES